MLHNTETEPYFNEPMLGAYEKIELSAIDKEIDSYIREQLPQLKDATLYAAQHQVVAGMNYKYSYQNGDSITTVVVWDQPWTKLRQITSISKVEKTKNEAG